MDNKARTYRLSSQAITYIEKQSDRWNVSNTKAIERMIQEHSSLCQEELIADAVVKKIEERHSNLFTRIRLATTMTGRNVDVILEILNTIIVNENIQNAYTSRIAKSDVWEDCEEEVKRRIAEYKQINDNKKKNKGGGNITTTQETAENSHL